MLTAKDVKGVMAMMPAFGTADAGDLQSPYTVDLDNMTDGINRMIGDGIDIITTTGSFGECYNLYWEEFQDLAKAAVETVKKRVPLFIGTTSPNPRDVVRKMKFVQELKADGVLVGIPYYDPQSPDFIGEFYRQIAELFPNLAIMVYHNPVNHKVKIPVSVFPKLIKCPNIIAMKDSHRDTREFVQLQKVIEGKISVLVNQAQLFPFYRMGAAGCWSIDSWLGPWPVLHLRNLVYQGKDDEARKVVGEILGDGGGGRPGPSEGTTGKLPLEFAGYCKPGPTRTPIVQFTPAAIERAKKKAEHWKALCEKYRPLVEAQAPIAAAR